MRKFQKIAIFAMMVIFSLTCLIAQETKIINGFTVARGERPVIDLSKVPADAYEPEKIWVKLAPEMEEFIKDNVILVSPKGESLNTGVVNIDKLNAKYNVSKIKPMQYGYYETSPAAAKYRDRHKAWGFHLWMEVYLPEGTNVIDAVKEYNGLSEVEFAEPVYKTELYEGVSSAPYVEKEKTESAPKLTVNDTRYSEQWHYNNTGQQGGTVDCDIDLPEAWDIERGNNQVLVAVQDQGIQLNHPDLAASVWSGVGYDFVSMDTSIEPGDHGCHTSGTISAVSNNNIGVAGIAGGTGSGDGVRLMSVQVYSDAGSGNSNLPYEYSADNDAVISQNSWGYTSVGYYNQVVLDGIDYFNVNGGGTALEGGLVIFAAGNSDATGLWYPGCYSGAMAVAATDKDDVRAYYSNYGDWVEIAAPGGYTGFTDDPEGVLSCWSSSNYGFYQGTSMACPHVSGVAALIISLAPGVFTNQEVRDILKNTTDNIDAENPSYIGELGTGRLNAYAALNEVLANLSNVERPASILVDALSTDQIDIDWTKNAANDDVMLVYTSDGNFGTPVNGTSYSVSQTIPGGGTVLATGSGTSYSHTGLTDQTMYYYRAYSYDNSDEYSAPRASSAQTLMAPVSPSAASLGFENSGSIPAGWTQDGNWTFVGSGTYPSSPSEGSYFAYFSTLNSTKKIITPRFDLTTHTGVTIDFDYCVTSKKSGPTTYYDKLKVYYKTSLAGSWVQLGSEYSGSNTSWQNDVLNIDDADRTNDFYIAFEAIVGTRLGYGVSVDNIVINGTPAGGNPPAAPGLVSPTDASLTTDLTPTFDWSDAADATSYTILVDNNSNFGSPEINQSPTSSTFTPGSNLAEGTYYWKVLSSNASGSSSYSSTWSVVLGSTPGVPSLVTPADVATLYTLQPTFDWNDIAGADTYTILVDNNSNFGSPEVDQSPTSSTFTPGADMALGTYYWKVLATNAFGSSSYSTTWDFTISPLSAVVNIVTNISGSDLVIDWDVVEGATGYDVYSSDDPYGTFTFAASVGTNQYTVAADQAKLFYYIVATN